MATAMMETTVIALNIITHNVHNFVKNNTNPPTFHTNPKNMDRNSTQLNHSIRQGFIFKHTKLKNNKQTMFIDIKAISIYWLES